MRMYPEVLSSHSKPERIFTIHGEEKNTIDLASSIYKRFRIETHSPKNLETYRMV